ncbi:anthranilate phosphoribosyltransferase [Candidatus Woesearchaeota archaeon]|nr:anthranilate phosphoribosyltransferase [Candidatus Woesearchaeota archaeon]|tara:strand:+ start:2528 stop:3544 length:1017 start_codon:yes stop_codon:yes gene_type:complete
MIKSIIAKLVEKQDLAQDETEQVMNQIMEGNVADEDIVDFLVALRDKGETIDEITACVKIMRQKASTIRPNVEYLVDTCGTGGDESDTFNISTAAAFVVAGANVAVAKHGNKSVSSKCGSADVLRELGVNIELQPKLVEKCIEEVGVGFMFAPIFHPAMKYAVNARKQIGTRTIFNILGPLTNPANALSQLIGVFDENLLKDIAEVLKNLGSKHVMVVNGHGLDEITICGKTRVCELKNGEINSYELNPEEFGFKLCTIEEIKGGDPKENAEIILKILNGFHGPKRGIVLLNAAAALLTSGIAKDYKDALKLAVHSIDSGKSLEKLNALIRFTNKNAQ